MDRERDRERVSECAVWIWNKSTHTQKNNIKMVITTMIAKVATVDAGERDREEKWVWECKQ